jgi:hypothetical protein
VQNELKTLASPACQRTWTVVPVVISDVKSGAAGKIQSSWTVVACASCTDNKGMKRRNSISICVVTLQSEYFDFYC